MFFVGEKGNEMVICRKMYCIVAQPVKRFSTLLHCSFFVRLKFLREAVLPLPNWRISSLYNRFVFINLIPLSSLLLCLLLVLEREPT